VDNVGATQLNDLSDAKTGGYSVFIGNNAGTNDDASNNLNVGIGKSALQSNTTGYYNTANGYSALSSNTTGYDNTANGAYALYHNTTGNNNVALGYRAGYNNETGDKNIFLGFQAGYSETGSDKLYIANSSTATPLIYGDFNSKELTVNASSLSIDNVGGQAILFINASGTNNPSSQYYLDDTFKTSSGYSVSNDAYFIYHGANVYFKQGDILPAGHKTQDLGASGNAWDNVYADNYINQGAAAFTDRNVTDEIIAHPPIAKNEGDFDDKTSDGLYELNPNALPKALRTENGIKIDEIATYNYKANYEQQVIINEQQKQIDELKKQLKIQQGLLKKLLNNK
jgi:hypothetical protein